MNCLKCCSYTLFNVSTNSRDLYEFLCFIDPRPSTNQSTSLKSGSLFLVMVSVRTYKTKQTDQRVKPLCKLVLWLVLGRGSLYDSSLVWKFNFGSEKHLDWMLFSYCKSVRWNKEYIAQKSSSNLFWSKCFLLYRMNFYGP